MNDQSTVLLLLYNQSGRSSIRDEVFERISKCVKIDQESLCWNWQGQTSGTGRGGGYGRISVHGHTSATHRVMWSLIHGYLPAKKQIDHTCRNRLCCNPQHLEMVTHLQNQRRKPLKILEDDRKWND